jgi:hypothetical protein
MMESDWVERDMAEWLRSTGRGGATPDDWQVRPLRIVPGGPRPESPAGQQFTAQLRELGRRERAVRRQELRLTIVSYMVAFALALEVLLAVLVVEYGNHRLDAPSATSAASTTERR